MCLKTIEHKLDSLSGNDPARPESGKDSGEGYNEATEQNDPVRPESGKDSGEGYNEATKQNDTMKDSGEAKKMNHSVTQGYEPYTSWKDRVSESWQQSLLNGLQSTFNITRLVLRGADAILFEGTKHTIIYTIGVDKLGSPFRLYMKNNTTNECVCWEPCNDIPSAVQEITHWVNGSNSVSAAAVPAWKKW